MLVALVYLYRKRALSRSPIIARRRFRWRRRRFCFSRFAAFAVKMPMTPGAHMAARRACGSADRRLDRAGGGDVKVGRVRLLRLSLPIAPDASQRFGWLIIALSLVAIVYIGVVALMQKDMKKLIAYSSVRTWAL